MCEDDIEKLSVMAYCGIEPLSCHKGVTVNLNNLLQQSKLSMQWRSCDDHYNDFREIVIEKVVSSVVSYLVT